MTLLRTVREVWPIETAEDRHVVDLELRKILASAHFCNSKRYPALLRYIVEHALAGRVEQLKERTLGIEVFQRPPDYDTNADTVVRYTAGEVRKRLALYYHENEADWPVQIVLPVGSYVPEFLRATPDELAGQSQAAAAGSDAFPDAASSASHADETEATLASTPAETSAAAGVRLRSRSVLIRIAVVVVLIAALAGILKWRYSVANQQTAVDQFWAPVLHQSGTALLCSGAVVFAPEQFSGVITANKDNEYPFVSIQTASAIARLSGLLERNRIEYQMQPCTSTPVTELRERPLILLGGYNNQWTLRLVEPLRFTFGPSPVESIVDRDHPQTRWQRDPSKTYSSADDYGLIARFHDPTTDSMVVVVAGLGRNGTEAAGQFVTSPHYMKLLSDRLGHDLTTRNIEAVLKVNVIDGRTGAPSLEEAYSW